MLFPRARLVVSICLFVGWLAVLATLVVENQHMIVLSRPQLLGAPICVIAELTAKDGHPDASVTVLTVVWADGVQVPSRIEVPALATLSPKEGYEGPGSYILALTPAGSEYEIVPVPTYPSRVLRIYPLTPQTKPQLEEIKKLRG